MTETPPSPGPPGSSQALPPFDPRWFVPPPPGWAPYPMAPPPRPQADPRALPVKIQVWAVVEIVLGALLIGTILVNQASWQQWVQTGGTDTGYTTGAPLYMTLYAYAAGLLLAVALVMAIRGLLSGLDARLARFRASQLAVAVSAVLLAGGYLLMMQIVSWTTPCGTGCFEPAVNANTVVSSVAIDLGAGLAGALLPGALWLWSRARSEARAVPPAAGPPPASVQ